MNRGSCLLPTVVCFLLLILPGLNKCWSQAGSIFDHITTEHGLSSNGVHDLLQDKEGFYWIATRNGLDRFDGTNIKVFFNNPDDSTSLIHNHCTSLAEDNAGNIWVGTLKGISCFIKKENRFLNFIFHDPQIPADNLNRVAGLFKDGEGNIWAYGILLMKYDQQQQKWINYMRRFPYKDNVSLSLHKSASYDAFQKGVWVATHSDLFFLQQPGETIRYSQNNPDRWRIFSYAGTAWQAAADVKGRIWFYDDLTQHIVCFLPATNELKQVMPVTRSLQRIRADESGRLWIFYWNGPAIVYDESTGLADSSLFVYGYPKSIIHPNASNLYIDRDSNYWIASRHGISILNRQEQFFRYHILNDRADNNALGGLSITQLAEASVNRLWVATNQGLYQYDLAKNQFDRIRHPLVKQVKAVFQQNDTLLWLSTGHTVVRYNTITRKAETTATFKSHVVFFRKDAQQKIWASTWMDGLYCLDQSGKIVDHIVHDSSTTQSLRSNSIVTLEHGHQPGIFWIGYNSGHGYTKYDADKRTFEHFRIQLPRSRDNVSNIISCIFEEANGNRWLGTYGGGLYYFNQANNSYTNYLQANGLLSNFINDIFPDNKGNLWITTTSGLNFLNSVTRQIIPVSVDLELPSNDFIANALPGKEGKFYFFTENRIAAVDPEKFINATVQTQPLLISSVKVFDREIASSDLFPRLSLSYDDNFFSFEFSLLKTNPGMPVQYAYQLKGFDEGWNQAFNRNSVNYTNVPPGNYTFLVKAANQSGQWMYQAEPLTIRIAPPFWRTAWFWLIVFMLLLASGYVIYRNRMNQYKRLQEMRNKISRDLHDEIGATLSGIAMYSHLTREKIGNNVPQVQPLIETIQRSATEMVNKLNDMVWVVNPKHDSIEKLVQRLEEFALEMAALKNMEVTINISPQLAAMRLDMQSRKNIYLIAKEAIHNAIKYSNASHLKLSATSSDRQLHIVIEDNGSGFDISSVKRGNGLNNMMQRAVEIGADCNIKAIPATGTIVSVSYRL
jgi:signal transduction histidine kinase/ligand-binding sensor domain-containing protein